ncbi:MAG: 4Fe-4S binding protein [Negativicutes bacterium]|nr:4Fe-4S binding protein [Negativicutes bacterium]
MLKPSIKPFRYPTTKEEMPVGPYADAGVLAESNAGWRVNRPVLDSVQCVKCQKCWLICPDGAIERGEVYLIDYSFCKGCGLCAYECPKKAIIMVQEGDKGE